MAIEGVVTLNSQLHTDDRGQFVKTYQKSPDSRLDNFEIAEIFYSKTRKGAGRGMHLQIGDSASNRIISCPEGKIFDILIDLRTSSKTFLEVETQTLGPNYASSILVPSGVAHGFIAEEYSITHYISDKPHDPKSDTGIRISSLKIELPFKNILLSTRDQQLPTLEDWILNTK